jgi:hypothetical protein
VPTAQELGSAPEITRSLAWAYPLSGRVGPERLVGPSVTFLNMPFVARDAVKGAQIRQGAIARRSAKKLHRSRTVMAARGSGRGLVGVAHERSPADPPDVVRGHYRRMANSLIIGKTSLRRRREDQSRLLIRPSEEGTAN